MKAILCTQYCGPDELVLGDIPDPVAGPGEVVIAIKAAALNFFDLLMIQGKYQVKPPFPFSPGCEVAGLVHAVGEGVADLRPGQRAFAFVGHGGMAEQVVTAAQGVTAMPDGLDDVTAAAFPVVYGTSYHALKDRAAQRRLWRLDIGDQPARQARYDARLHAVQRLVNLPVSFKKERNGDNTYGEDIHIFGCLGNDRRITMF